jgi:hypothetical protein
MKISISQTRPTLGLYFYAAAASKVIEKQRFAKATTPNFEALFVEKGIEIHFVCMCSSEKYIYYVERQQLAGRPSGLLQPPHTTAMICPQLCQDSWMPTLYKNDTTAVAYGEASTAQTSSFSQARGMRPIALFGMPDS